MDFISRKVGFDVIDYRVMCHTRRSLSYKLRELSNNLIYVAGSSVGGLGIPKLRRLFVERQAPMWLSANDHMFAILRKR